MDRGVLPPAPPALRLGYRTPLEFEALHTDAVTAA
jgi:hypothetical protein